MVKEASGIVKYVKAHQPISVTGALRHCYLWLTSPLFSTKLQFDNENFAAQQHEKTITVYCVHATADTGAACQLLASRLIENLPDSIDSIKVVSFKKRLSHLSIEDYAEQLLQNIKKNNDENVIVIGHSRGGIISAYFTEHLAQLNKINVIAAFTIGSPFFRGSNWAIPFSWIAPEGSSITQMKPECEFAQALSKKVRNSLIPYFHFAAEKDWLVSYNAAHPYLGTPRNLCILPRHGHLSMMSSHKLVARIQQAIQQLLDPESVADEVEFALDQSKSNKLTLTIVFLSLMGVTACGLALAGVAPPSEMSFLFLGLNFLPVAGQVIALLMLGSTLLVSSSYLVRNTFFCEPLPQQDIQVQSQESSLVNH